MQEWKGLTVGDRVIVGGRSRHPGRVVSISSNRRSGGVYVHVVFPDGSRVGCRPRDLEHVIEPVRDRAMPPDHG